MLRRKAGLMRARGCKGKPDKGPPFHHRNIAVFGAELYRSRTGDAMRTTILLALVALGAAAITSQAAAQDPYRDGLLRPPAVSPVETSPIQRFSKDARDWIGEESARQAAAPSDLTELAVAIELNIGPDIDKIARRERIGDGDLFMVVMHNIVSPAHDAAEAELTRLRDAGASDIEIQIAATRKALLKANLDEVVGDLTVVSRSLIPDLAWREQ